MGRKVTTVMAMPPGLVFRQHADCPILVTVDHETLLGRQHRKNSMWQLDSEATNASSGSTALGSDNGTRTT